jgi:hypothetical protein
MIGHVPIWQGIHVQQQELLELDDIGPAGLQRARDALSKAEKVLGSLIGNEPEDVKW